MGNYCSNVFTLMIVWERGQKVEGFSSDANLNLKLCVARRWKTTPMTEEGLKQMERIIYIFIYKYYNIYFKNTYIYFLVNSAPNVWLKLITLRSRVACSNDQEPQELDVLSLERKARNQDVQALLLFLLSCKHRFKI